MQAGLVTRRLALSESSQGGLSLCSLFVAIVDTAAGGSPPPLMLVRTTSGGLINSERRKHPGRHGREHKGRSSVWREWSHALPSLLIGSSRVGQFCGYTIETSSHDT